MTEVESSIALSMVPRLGPVRFYSLRTAFGSAAAILSATEKELCKVERISEELARAILNWEDHSDLSAELAHMKHVGARALTYDDPEYPVLLHNIYDPPIVLYILGKIKPCDHQTGIGIVGTRRASHYAIESTKRLSYQLAYSGLTVYSGLARGVDTAAHQAALAANGRTVAVLGSGLCHLYPEENIPLVEKIAASGAVISEFPMNVSPTKQTFPKRNRIISGCSFGLLVVEAGVRSGALISAHQALEQGRSLYAVPGRIDNAEAIGSNRLIQQGAKLVLDAQDILSDLSLIFSEPPELHQSQPRVMLKGDELAIYQAISNDPTPIDSIISETQLSPSVVSSKLLALELSGQVKALPGGRFVKLM